MNDIAKNKYEILSPAGSVDQLVASVNNGCDSVYLGLNLFNARMKAPNFDEENLSKWIDYCHLYGVKVYVAINTSIKNDEFERAADMLGVVYKSNADGVILTDLTLIEIASKFPKPFDVVASTQLNCHDKYGAEFLKNLGATTVVCSRECSYNNIKEIAETGVNVECFIHGALCVCQSGQCLFSSIVGGNSGNRGLCAQPCRKLYTLKDTQQIGYFLSARDINGTKFANKLLNLGVNTFKIEGRNRSAEYAGQASKYYKGVLENNFSDIDEEKLNETYNRNNTKDLSYLDGKNDKIIYKFANNHLGVPVGKIKILKENNKKIAKIVADKEILKGDSFKIFNKNEYFCAATATSSGKKNDLVSVQLFDFLSSKNVQDGMIANRTSSIAITKEVLGKKKKLPVKIKLNAKINRQPTITAIYEKSEYTFTADYVLNKASESSSEKSDKIESIGNSIKEQLYKTGETCFTITDIDLNLDEIFIAKSQINELRRNVLEGLKQKIVLDYNLQFGSRQNFDAKKFINVFIEQKNSFCDQQKKLLPKKCLAVNVYTENYLSELCKSSYFENIKYLIYKPSLIDKSSLVKTAQKTFFYLDLPSFCDLSYLKTNLPLTENFGLVCNNVGQVQFARENNLQYIAGRGLNIFNDYMALQFNDADSFVYSYELSLQEINQFKIQNGLIFVDGCLPLMQLQHCPYKVAFNCDCSSCVANKKKLIYVDEFKNEFFVYRRRDKMCRFELINGKKLSVAKKLNFAGRFLIDFDNVCNNPKDATYIKLLEHYINLINGTDDNYTENLPYTKGRLYDKIN